MKIKNSIIVLVITFIGLILIPLVDAGAETALDVQEDLLMSAGDKKSADVEIDLEIAFPDYPQIEPIVFSDDARIPYSISDQTIKVKGKNIPTLYEEIKDIPDSFKPLTVALRVKDKTITAKWDDDMDVDISSVDIEASVYKKKRDKITDSTKPTLKFVLSDLKMDVEDVDTSQKVIELGFKTKFPKTGNDLFDKLLAGKKITGTIMLHLGSGTKCNI